MTSNSMETEKMLLILDLDETLIHATERKLGIDPHFEYAEYFIYKRPFVDEFLVEMSQYFDLAIWSSAGDQYVNGVVNLIKPNEIELQFIWAQSRCTIRRDYELGNYVYEKRLKKIKNLGFRLEKALIIDDSPEKTRDNFGNAIYIQAFEGNPEDDELTLLSQYLKSIRRTENVRSIEKRGWRDKQL